MRSRSAIPNGTEKSAPRSKSSFCTRARTSSSSSRRVRGQGQPDVRVQLVDGAERGDPAVELRHARPVAEAGLAPVAAARVDARQPDGLVGLARHGHRLRPVELGRPASTRWTHLRASSARSRSGWTYVPPVREEAHRLIADDISRHEDVWLAEDDGRLLGFLAIRRSRTEGWEVLEKLYVDPDAQSRGIGTHSSTRRRRSGPTASTCGCSRRTRGRPLLRAPRVPPRQAHRRRRQHGARARRALCVALALR